VHRTCVAVAAFLIGVGTFACASSEGHSAPPKGSCPTAPVPVVVSVDQWGDIVDQLAGDCGDVTTIIKGSSADPHDYEPTPSDTAAFGDAKLVVVNGLDYDAWATKAVDALDEKPEVVDGGDVVGLDEGDNPHIWYGPTYVREVSDAVTTALEKLAPSASDYLDQQATDWKTALEPYDAAIARVKGVSTGKTYGATEGVFDDMAHAVGLTDRTPSGYRNAAANGTDPAPGDVNAFEQALANEAMTVLIYNTQTEGSVPAQLRSRADTADVPVVDVTETVPSGAGSFVAWQVEQLQHLATALGA
jgi:zinc/manganese transport system substrate-binding protein